MSKNSSEATEKPGTGVLRMARVNCNKYNITGGVCTGKALQFMTNFIIMLE